MWEPATLLHALGNGLPLHAWFKLQRNLIRTLLGRLPLTLHAPVKRFLKTLDWFTVPRLVAVVSYRYFLSLATLFFSLKMFRLLLRVSASVYVHISKFTSRLLALVRLGNGANARHWDLISELREGCDEAETYDEWEDYAYELDKQSGKHAWKDDPKSPLYDHQRLASNLDRLRMLVDANDVRGTMCFLRSRLRRNFHGSGNPELYVQLNVGTKTLVDNFRSEVVAALNGICLAPTKEEDPVEAQITLLEKMTFFEEVRHTYGRSAFMFSGGGTLGFFHAGVLKCLVELGMLPKIVSGSSVGSLWAVLVGSRTDEELLNILEPGQIALNFFHPEDGPESLWTRLKRVVTKGHLLEIQFVQRAIRANCGDLTFAEAYERTGRIINITVSPSSNNHNTFLLLNYLTTPNVLLWSAASASCAIPGVFAPVALLVKDEHGNIVGNSNSGTTWTDGSVVSDLPYQRLSELFNVNHFIVSQVNPHVIPFIYPLQEAYGLVPDAIRTLLNLLAAVVQASTHGLDRIGHVVGLRPHLQAIRGLFGQNYRGDVTIVPTKWTLLDLLKVLSNPTYEDLIRKAELSHHDTFPYVPIIHGGCEVEQLLERCLHQVRADFFDHRSKRKRTRRRSTASEKAPNNSNFRIGRLTTVSSFSVDTWNARTSVEGYGGESQNSIADGDVEHESAHLDINVSECSDASEPDETEELIWHLARDPQTVLGPALPRRQRRSVDMGRDTDQPKLSKMQAGRYMSMPNLLSSPLGDDPCVPRLPSMLFQPPELTPRNFTPALVDKASDISLLNCRKAPAISSDL